MDTTECKNTSKVFQFKQSNYFNEAIEWLLSVALFTFDIYRCFWNANDSETGIEVQYIFFQYNLRTAHCKHTQARKMQLISIWRHIKWECSPTYTGAAASAPCPTGQYLLYFFLHKKEFPLHSSPFLSTVTLLRYYNFERDFISFFLRVWRMFFLFLYFLSC